MQSTALRVLQVSRPALLAHTRGAYDADTAEAYVDVLKGLCAPEPTYSDRQLFALFQSQCAARVPRPVRAVEDPAKLAGQATQIARTLSHMCPGYNASDTHVYVDVGGGDGRKAAAVASELKLNVPPHVLEERSVGAHGNWGLLSRSAACLYDTYDARDPFPYADASVTLMTLLNVVHHVHNVKHLFDEVYRCLRPGGVLVLRDHNAQSRQLCDMLRVAHLVMAADERYPEGVNLDCVFGYYVGMGWVQTCGVNSGLRMTGKSQGRHSLGAGYWMYFVKLPAEK